MAKVLILSREFPKYHPRAGEQTKFVEQFFNSIYKQIDLTGKNGKPFAFLPGFNEFTTETKHHTIRQGKRWKVGDKFSPRVWSGKPYRSKQIILCEDVEIKKVYDFEMIAKLFIDECEFYINGRLITYPEMHDISQNDGMNYSSFLHWFCGANIADSNRKSFSGQIICWNETINYN